MKSTILLITFILMTSKVLAVTPGEDIATTINLHGFACGLKASNIVEKVDKDGNKKITASCANGKKYQILVTNKGRVSVAPV